jgi:hypothetical protein
MKFFIILILISTTSALADTYIEKSGNKCPPGYSDTKGNYCRSYSDEPKQVLTKTGGKCPPDWSNTKGNYCVNSGRDPDDVIVKSGDKCPSGYSNTQGGYCKR